MENKAIISKQEIENQIYTVRDQQVMLDSYLARIYQVETKNLKPYQLSSLSYLLKELKELQLG